MVKAMLTTSPLLQLEDVKMYEAIKFVRLENLADQLDVSAMESLLSKISSFPNLETLILRNCGLVNVGLISCSRLVYCDLTNNNIRELDSVVEMASKCLHLDSLDLTGNPLLRRAIWKVRAPCTALSDFTLSMYPIVGWLEFGGHPNPLAIPKPPALDHGAPHPCSATVWNSGRPTSAGILSFRGRACSGLRERGKNLRPQCLFYCSP